MTLNCEMALILRYAPNSVASGVHCVKVVDKAITMDNLRLLCLVVNVCRGTARLPWYKYSITARWIFCSRFINSRCAVLVYLSSILLNEVGFISGILKYVCDIVIKRFTFAVSSFDEFLSMHY